MSMQGMDSGLKSDSMKPEATIEHEISRLRNNISELAQTVNGLMQRYDPAMRAPVPSPGPIGSDMNAGPAHTAPLAQYLYEANADLRQSINRLQDMLERCEL